MKTTAGFIEEKRKKENKDNRSNSKIMMMKT